MKSYKIGKGQKKKFNIIIVDKAIFVVGLQLIKACLIDRL